MNTGRRVTSIPDWQLERFRLDELPPQEFEAVRAALEQDPALRQRLDALEASDREILARHTPRELAAAIRGRRAVASSRSTGLLPTRPAFRFAFAALCALVLVEVGIGLAPKWRASDEPADTTRIKGLEPRLVVYRKGTSSDPEQLQPGSAVRQGDVLQIAYQAAGHRHGVIVSVDGRGEVTRHLPVAGNQAAALQPGRLTPLGQAYELDDAPGFERFYLVTADEPFDVETVFAAVKHTDETGPNDVAGGHLELPATFSQFSFLLRKDASR